MEPLTLTDDELQTALDAAAHYRDALLSERQGLNLAPVVIREGDALPDPDSIDGRIMCVAALIMTLTMEAMRRDLAERDERKAKLEE